MSHAKVHIAAATLCGETGTLQSSADPRHATCVRCLALQDNHLLRHVPDASKTFWWQIARSVAEGREITLAELTREQSLALEPLLTQRLADAKYRHADPLATAVLVPTMAAIEAHQIATERVAASLGLATRPAPYHPEYDNDLPATHNED